MSDTQTYPYEGMFLFPQAMSTDMAGVTGHIEELLARADAEIMAMTKWDERQLAYEIDKNRRGLYILTYFRAPGGKMTSLERDCNLSERVLRYMFIRADHLSEDEMRALDARDAMRVEATAPAAAPTAVTPLAESPAAATDNTPSEPVTASTGDDEAAE